MSSTARKATPRKLHLKLAAVVFMALYLPLGYLFLDAVYPSLETPSQILTSLILPAPIFVLIAGWLWIESRLQRNLVHRLPPSPMPVSPAQIKTERKATIALLFLVGFICGGSFIPALMTGDLPGLTQAAPLIVWAFLFKIYGLNRLRHGAILMISPSGVPDEMALDKELQEFMTGYILAHKKGSATFWDIDIRADRNVYPPMICATAIGTPIDPTVESKETLTLSPNDSLALQVVLTGNGDPYRMSFQHFRRTTLSLDALSAHQRITCLKRLADERRNLKHLYTSADLKALDDGASSPA